MRGMGTAGDGSPPAQLGPVELVPSLRGGTKAKYGGRTFTLETDNGIRYRWRCDVRPCRSRLTTDAYGKAHMVYAFRPHDEDVHLREAARKKRRSEATFKQAVTKIGGFGYVLENQAGNMLFWRCEYVSCPGRCRTTPDLHLVAGPTHHLKELHGHGGRPDTCVRVHWCSRAIILVRTFATVNDI
ncbi:hypothetical protein V5799_017812 [Amblyomma americanum]|uniref:FLYWCH-type domain-containing protein n=1 Tax=Amblyomma americanum TaxID=6943 RepID=A0AAQ4F172_AMBAM